MKTTSTVIKNSDGWVDLSTKTGITFDADTPYVLQARGGQLLVSLSDSEPSGNDYIAVNDGEKFTWTYDGIYSMYVNANVSSCIVAIS